MGDGDRRKSRAPDAALAYGVTVLCCQFMSDDHTSDVLQSLPMLLERSSGDKAFAEIRDAALVLLAARRADAEGAVGQFFAARIECRRAVEKFSWRRFCDLYDEARSVTPRHTGREPAGAPIEGRTE